MNEIQHYQPQPRADLARTGKSDLDSWINAMGDIARLSEYIAETEFVPDAMRGKAPAVAAAILTGREMGIEPMTALRHIHVIKGKPGVSAELMRAQVLKAGHEIQPVETTDSRCVMAGRRRGEQEWTRVTFTADQARKARIDLGGYPEDKLFARATTRLCRRKFADVIAGLAAVDELEDGEQPEQNGTTEPKQRRTAQRRATSSKHNTREENIGGDVLVGGMSASASNDAGSRPASGPATPAPSRPPLPGEDGYDDGDPEPDSPQDVPTDIKRHDEEAEQAAESMITRDQSSKLHAIFTRAGFSGPGSRGDRMRVSSGIVERDLGSSNDLTKQEASALIDTLEMLADRGELADDVDVLLAAVHTARQEADDEAAQMAEYEAEQQATDDTEGGA